MLKLGLNYTVNFEAQKLLGSTESLNFPMHSLAVCIKILIVILFSSDSNSDSILIS